MISFITYNILFDLRYFEQRIGSICDIIEEKDPDFICLQEVTNNMIPILRERFPKLNFSRKELTQRYDTLILTKHKIQDVLTIPFTNTKMDRNIHYVESVIDDKLITVVTTHLESVFSSTDLSKYDQLSTIFKMFHEKCNVFIMGDTNINTEISLYKLYKDAWLEIGNKVNEFTFDYTMNSNILGDYKSRIDRVFYSPNVNVNKFELIGTENTVMNLPPSDHFGIYTEFE